MKKIIDTLIGIGMMIVGAAVIYGATFVFRHHSSAAFELGAFLIVIGGWAFLAPPYYWLKKAPPKLEDNPQ